MSDEDKIRLQMELDIQQYGEEVIYIYIFLIIPFQNYIINKHNVFSYISY